MLYFPTQGEVIRFMRKWPASKKRLQGSKKSVQPVSELQRQTEIRQAFAAAKEKFVASGPMNGFVHEIVLAQQILRGAFRDIPDEQWKQNFGESRKETVWRLLLHPFLEEDEQYFIKLAKAFRELKRLSEELPWEVQIFEAFDFLLEQFEKTGGSFPWDRDPVKKLAKHIRALRLASFPDNRDNKIRDYLPVKITEIPPADRELVKKAMRTIKIEPRWGPLFVRCGLSLLKVNKGGHPGK